MLISVPCLVVHSLNLSGQGASPIDRSTPEKTLQALVDALISQKVEIVLACIEGAKPSAFTEEFVKNSEKSPPELRLIIAQTKIKTLPDGSVEVHFDAILKRSGNEVQRNSDLAHLRKNNGQWQVIPPTREQAKATIDRMRTGTKQPGDFVNGFIIPFAYPEAGIAARRGAQQAQAQEDKEMEAIRQAEIKREVGRLARLVDAEVARKSRQVRPSVTMALTESAYRAHLRLQNLRELKENEYEPYTQRSDGFTSAQLKAALTEAEKEVKALQAEGTLLTASHGTPIKVQNYQPVALRPAEAENPLKFALSGQSLMGLWQVEVRDGALKGKVFWTDLVVGQKPTFGDTLTLAIPKKLGVAIPAAVDLAAADALVAGGRVGDSKALARFDRLIQEKRFVLLPANTACDFVDQRTDGSCYLVRPTEGTYKGQILFVRVEHAVAK